MNGLNIDIFRMILLGLLSCPEKYWQRIFEQAPKRMILSFDYLK